MVVKVRPYWLPREIACVLLILVYCPVFDKPSHANVKDVVAKLHTTIEKSESDNPNAAILVLGDFNSASINLKRYKQYVNCTTRNNKTLDKLYTLHDYQYKSYKKPQLGNSDHHSVLLLPYNHRLSGHRTKPKKITKQLWSDDNIKALQNCLDDTDWSVFFDNPSVSVQAETIKDYLLYCIEQNIPTQTVYQHHDKPWMNTTIRQLLSKRQQALQNHDDATYRNCQQQIQQEIRYAKRQIGKQVDEKFQSDAKSAWDMLKSLLKLKDKHVECSVDVDSLNKFFARFESDHVTPFLPDVNPSLEMFSVNQVYNVLVHVDVGKGSGPDGVSARIIRTLADCISEPVCKLFNNSIQTAVMPDIWKSANIVPLPKTKGASQPKDFRPIALTPILSKCLERLVAPEITRHITDETQYAYKTNRSTDDALITLLDKITEHIDRAAGNYVRAVFIDYSSAFNTINPTSLIHKMVKKAIDNNIINWTYNFLTTRSQRVKANGEISHSITTSTGSPQGCVLSPRLFSLYVEDMPVSDSFTIIKYADDTVLLEFLTSNQPSSLQSEVNNLKQWCDDNSLSINASKTKEVVFSNKRSDPEPPPITIGSHHIEQVESYKYLGTTIHKKLNFDANTDAIISKAEKRLFIVKQLAKLKVKPSTIRLAYKTFLESVLLYHLPIIYGHLSADNIRQYNHVIKSACSLSRGQLEDVGNIDDVYKRALKTKCLRMTCTSSESVLVFDKLPSGRLRAVKHRVNARKFCFRAQCIRFYNKIF